MKLNSDKCYEILGLPLRASLHEIKKAYRILAKKWHPDLFHGVPKKQKEGEEKLKKINAAYDFLQSNRIEAATQKTEKSAQQQNEENRRARAEREAKRSAKRKEKARGRQLRRKFSKFHRLAKRGIAEAQYRLAILFRNGQGCVRNKTEALQWFKNAAAGGDPRAMLYLGFAFAWGINVSAQISQAIKLYETAAEKGFAEAHFHLGFMYYFGLGVNQDFEKAVKLYRNAVEHGYKISDHDTCDHLRLETPKEYFTRYKWYVLGVQRATFE